MISFSLSAHRNLDVDAWEVRVDAFFDPSEEVSGCTAVKEAIAEAWDGDDGIRIGRLNALMLHIWPVRTAEGLLELLEINGGDGNTWDAYEEVRSTAAALNRWARGGAGAALFEESDEPVQTILLSRGLEVDPYVDRGALLGMMVQHLTALSPNRILLAHEEPPESALPADQQGREEERARAFLSVGERVGLCPFAVLLPTGEGSARTRDPLRQLLGGIADRPLLIASVLPDGPDYPEWTVWDDLEIELIDVAEWAQARLGVELTLKLEEAEEV
jgi:hypothetical protein